MCNLRLRDLAYTSLIATLVVKTPSFSAKNQVPLCFSTICLMLRTPTPPFSFCVSGATYPSKRTEPGMQLLAIFSASLASSPL